MAMENPSSKDVTFKCQVPGNSQARNWPEMISPYFATQRTGEHTNKQRNMVVKTI